MNVGRVHIPATFISRGIDNSTALGTREKTQSRSSLEPARAARRKKRGGTPPAGGGGGFEVSNLDPPIRTRGPILLFSQFHCSNQILERKNFRSRGVLATF